eukprot:c12323_g1_i1.p1 GENE.c12323_g1_i1~~c12323_g1_i1.p1  ORF type:complete len:1388 (+),score=373.23 c12323_g1_i1:100-4164(+)
MRLASGLQADILDVETSLRFYTEGSFVVVVPSQSNDSSNELAALRSRLRREGFWASCVLDVLTKLLSLLDNAEDDVMTVCVVLSVFPKMIRRRCFDSTHNPEATKCVELLLTSLHSLLTNVDLPKDGSIVHRPNLLLCTKYLEIVRLLVSELEDCHLQGDLIVKVLNKCLLLLTCLLVPTDLLDDEAAAAVSATQESVHAALVSIISHIFSTRLPSKGSRSHSTSSLPAKLLELVCVFLAHHSRHETSSSSSRAHMLQLVTALLESGGEDMGNDLALVDVVTRVLCLRLLQMPLIDTLEMNLVLRAFLLLHAHLRQHLHIQIEQFFSRILIGSSQGHSLPSPMQELVLECLVDLCAHPSAMAELLANYDSSLRSENIFELACRFLWRSPHPVGGHLNERNLISLEALLFMLRGLADRAASTSTQVSESAQTCRETRALKRRRADIAAAFNKKVKDGVKLLRELHSELQDAGSFEGYTAEFMCFSPGLNKTAVGELLGEGSSFANEVLSRYCFCFDFAGVTFDMALRMLLDSFWLPGEAQKIARIMEAFATSYCSQNKEPFEIVDAAYVTAYSLIMLNTDHHSGQVKKKMTFDQFTTNNRGTNNGKNLPTDVMEKMYFSIALQPLSLPDMHHHSQSASSTPSLPTLRRTVIADTRYLHLLLASKQPGYPKYMPVGGGEFDADMFGLLSAPCVASLSVVFDVCPETNIPLLTKILEGFHNCAIAASHHRMGDVIDKVVISLCRSTYLPVSDTHPALSFGRSQKAQLAAVAVFDLVRKFSDHIREGWRNILNCLVRLHHFQVVPQPPQTLFGTFVNDADIGSSEHKALITVATARLLVAEEQRRLLETSGKGQSFFPSLSTFFTGSSTTAPPPEQIITDEARALTNQMAECLSRCCISDVFAGCGQMSKDATQYLVRALTITSLVGAETSTMDTSHAPNASLLSDVQCDTLSLCALLLANVVVANVERAEHFWILVHEHFQRVAQLLQPAQQSHQSENAEFCLKFLRRRLVLSTLQMACKFTTVTATHTPNITQLLSFFSTNSPATIIDQTAYPLIASFLDIATSEFAIENGAPQNVVVEYILLLLELTRSTSAKTSNAFKPLFQLCNRVCAFDEIDLGLLALLENFAANMCSPSFSDSPSNSVMFAMDTLSTIHTSLHKASNITTSQDTASFPTTRFGLSSHILSCLTQLIQHSDQQVRGHALVCIRRCVYDFPPEWMTSLQWTAVLRHYILPHAAAVASNQRDVLCSLSPNEQEVFLSRVLDVISKAFLRQLQKLSENPDFGQVWLEQLKFMGAFRSHSAELDVTAEEALKNVIMVVHTNGVLGQSGSPLWGQTLSNIGTWRVGLAEELKEMLLM